MNLLGSRSIHSMKLRRQRALKVNLLHVSETVLSEIHTGSHKKIPHSEEKILKTNRELREEARSNILVQHSMRKLKTVIPLVADDVVPLSDLLWRKSYKTIPRS